MPTVEFLPATAADIPILIRLARDIWHAHYPGIISIAQIDYMLARMYSETTIAVELCAGTVWQLLRVDGENVGYLSYSVDAARLNLHKLYVLPAWHGKGIGQAGLARAREAAVAASVRVVSLYVNKRNTKAIRAYERAGFTVAESLVNDFGDGYVMDDYRMEATVP